MKVIALDTNIAIDVLNEVPEVIQKLQDYDQLYLPITVTGELLYGAKNSAKRAQNLKRFRTLIAACEAINVDYVIAEAYSDIRLSLKQQGTPIPENDIWIAAAFRVNGLTLLTRDRHFQQVEGLDVEMLA